MSHGEYADGTERRTVIELRLITISQLKLHNFSEISVQIKLVLFITFLLISF